MRYYFDFHDGVPIMDTRGKRCRSRKDAEALATQIARELAASKDAEHRINECIIVKDESGAEVFRISLDDATVGHDANVGYEQTHTPRLPQSGRTSGDIS
jgi:hypothetical protein